MTPSIQLAQAVNQGDVDGVGQAAGKGDVGRRGGNRLNGSANGEAGIWGVGRGKSRHDGT